MQNEITIPANGWKPRWYQRPLWDFFERGGDRAIEIAHRRWGKDEVILNRLCVAALSRPASYWYCFPEFAQARKAIWTAVNPRTGRRRIEEAFPNEIVASSNDTEMFLKLVNGSTIQMIGSDRYDATVGAGVAGIVYSEWALANPSAWGYHRPILEENNGWAAFITTPRGNNHAKAMYDMALQSDRWFAEISNVHKTKALSAEQLEESLTEYQALYGADFGLAYFEQEYLRSFSGAQVGAIYGAEVARAEREGRICDVPVDPRYPVHTAWDLGKSQNNPIWCFQVIPGEDGPRIVDFYRPESDDLEEWCMWLAARGYHGTDYVPHDAVTGLQWGTKRTRIEMLRALGRKPKVIAAVPLQDGINAGNMTLRAAKIDADRCSLGVDGLKNYRREWDDDMKTFRANPVKDWSEHIGSAFRYLGLAWKEERIPVSKPEPKKELVYVARPDGVIMSNMSVKEAVEAMVRRKRRDDA